MTYQNTTKRNGKFHALQNINLGKTSMPTIHPEAYIIPKFYKSCNTYHTIHSNIEKVTKEISSEMLNIYKFPQLQKITKEDS